MCSPFLARFFEHPVTLPWRVKGSSGAAAELRARKGAGARNRSCLSRSVRFLDAGPEPRKYPKHRGLLREPVQGRRSIAWARAAGPVQEMLRRKFTDSIQP